MSGELKLYVVGESSGDPERWNQWASRVFVIATSPDDAIAECNGEYGNTAHEVTFDRRMVLCRDICRH